MSNATLTTKFYLIQTVQNLINDRQKISLEGEISYDKSPGSDGFTAEFFEIFWKQLGHFVIRSLNFGYKLGKLSVTQNKE
jgi:hypothetical protein